MTNETETALDDEIRHTQRTFRCALHGAYHGTGFDDQCPRCWADGERVPAVAPRQSRLSRQYPPLPCDTCEAPARGRRIEACFPCYDAQRVVAQ